jgi:Siphovirus Gp157
MSTLYQINHDINDLEIQLEELDLSNANPDEHNTFIEKWLCLEGELHSKLDNYGIYIRELETRAEVRKSEAKRLEELATVDENKVKALKASLLYVFTARNIKKLETKRFSFSRVKNGGKAPLVLNELTPISKIPEEYKTVIVQVSKEIVRKALESGRELPFARLGERGENIRIN